MRALNEHQVLSPLSYINDRIVLTRVRGIDRRHFCLDRVRQVLDIRVATQLLQKGSTSPSSMPACLASRHCILRMAGHQLLLREEINLEIHRSPLVRPVASFAVLGHQDEARQNDRLERDRQRQEIE